MKRYPLILSSALSLLIGTSVFAGGFSDNNAKFINKLNQARDTSLINEMRFKNKEKEKDIPKITVPKGTSTSTTTSTTGVSTSSTTTTAIVVTKTSSTTLKKPSGGGGSGGTGGGFRGGDEIENIRDQGLMKVY